MHEALNHAKLAMLFRKEFELCNVRKGETIVLLSDLGARRDYVSAALIASSVPLQRPTVSTPTLVHDGMALTHIS